MKQAPLFIRIAMSVVVVATLGAVPGCGGKSKDAGDGRVLLRVGHFPNITHAQGLVAHKMSRDGNGWFEQRLGPDVTIEWYVYNAGPTAMEALLNGSLDITYVGPNPALNAHIRSEGEEIRVIAGQPKEAPRSWCMETGASGPRKISAASGSPRRSSETRRTWRAGRG